MRRLIGWTMLLCLTLIVCCAAALAYGRAQPASSNPLREVGFDVCDGKPCFRGVVPGITTWKSAEAKFLHHHVIETHDSHILILIGRNHVDNISLERLPDSTIVDGIG